MLVSELIKRLEILKEKFGEVECMLYTEDIDGTEHGFYNINEVENTLEDIPFIYIAHREE